MLPSYLEKLSITELRTRAEALMDLLHECRICPNDCEVDRYSGNSGECCSSNEVLISSYGPHFGEEPPLVGNYGSGTIFLTSCNLSCAFCQNYDISHLRQGDSVSFEELAEIMMNLQSRGCQNINFVTPTHFTPQIVSAIVIAVEKGLELPIVYNCGGYESVETLKLLKDIIDIYMPDIKYSDNALAKKYSGVTNYWGVAKAALIEMNNQVGVLKVKQSGVAQRGVLIRHLVLPNELAGTKSVLEFIANKISKDSYVNIMDQYRPAFNAGNFPELDRRISSDELHEAIAYARNLSLHRGFE